LIQEKPMAVILEGCDGVGKSSVRVLLSEYDGNLFILERFTPSIYAYGKYFKRSINLDHLSHLEKRLLEAFIVIPIFLYCNPEELYRRYSKGRHVLKLSLEDLRKIQDLMIAFVRYNSYISWSKVDNSEISVEETFKFIRETFKL